jgi:hypothetical protein
MHPCDFAGMVCSIAIAMMHCIIAYLHHFTYNFSIAIMQAEWYISLVQACEHMKVVTGSSTPDAANP